MIAARRRRARGGRPSARRRVLVLRGRAERLTRQVDRRVNRLLVEAPRVRAWTAAVDRRANALLVRAWPRLERMLRLLRRLSARAWRLLRPLAVRLFRVLAALERRLLRIRDLTVRVATRASAVLTPQRAIALLALAAAACLAAAQFVDYRAVEIGQPGYAGLPAAEPPTVAEETARQAHSYMLLPVALLAAALALLAMHTPRRRDENRGMSAETVPSAGKRSQGLGRLVFLLGAISLGVALLVDMPAGLDAGAETSRFSGATAVLLDGFYAEVAAAAGLMLAGALLVLAPKAAARYHARPCRTRTNLLGRAASALRRRRRRRASSRARATRRRSQRRSGGVSAPASPR